MSSEPLRFCDSVKFMLCNMLGLEKEEKNIRVKVNIGPEKWKIVVENVYCYLSLQWKLQRAKTKKLPIENKEIVELKIKLRNIKELCSFRIISFTNSITFILCRFSLGVHLRRRVAFIIVEFAKVLRENNIHYLYFSSYKFSFFIPAWWRYWEIDIFPLFCHSVLNLVPVWYKTTYLLYHLKFLPMTVTHIRWFLIWWYTWKCFSFEKAFKVRTILI